VDGTECILDSSVERTPSALVVRIVLEKEVDLAILSLRHHVLFQIVLQFCSDPVREIRPAVFRHEEVARSRNV
jgi:hypothetical protein